MTREQILQARREAPIRFLNFRNAFSRADQEAVGETETTDEKLRNRLDVREGDTVVAGYGVRWNSRTQLLPGVYEQFARGAFSQGAMKDVRLLASHQGLAMARQSVKTFAAMEDEVGLRFMASLDENDSQAQTLVAKVKRGNVNGSSVGFTLLGGKEEREDLDDDSTLFTIREVGELFELSAVSIPQYEDATIELTNRSRFPMVGDIVPTKKSRTKHQLADIDDLAMLEMRLKLIERS